MNIFEKFNVTAVLLLISALAFAGQAKAQAQAEKPKLSISINVVKEVKQFKNNKWIVERVPANETRRGDILFYSINYFNEGLSEAREAAIVDPLPDGTVYVFESATGIDAEITFSIDGGRSYQPFPAQYTVQKPDGSLEAMIAPAEMYTHIKWTLRKPLLPGESGELGFKVEVR